MERRYMSSVALNVRERYYLSQQDLCASVHKVDPVELVDRLRALRTELSDKRRAALHLYATS